MTVKLALLKSGEEIISDIQELIVDKKVVGYIFNKPCSIKLQKSEEDDDTKGDSVKIRLIPWIILTKDNNIPVPLDWVITLVNPIDKLKEMYMEDVLNHGKEGNQDLSSREQASPDQSN